MGCGVGVSGVRNAQEGKAWGGAEWPLVGFGSTSMGGLAGGYFHVECLLDHNLPDIQGRASSFAPLVSAGRAEHLEVSQCVSKDYVGFISW